MPKRKIRARELALDVHTGMGDSILMKKYQLTPRQLESLLRKLVQADLISHIQLYERTTLSDSMITKAFVESEVATRELD
jgi:ribosomal protein S12